MHSGEICYIMTVICSEPSYPPFLGKGRGVAERETLIQSDNDGISISPGGFSLHAEANPDSLRSSAPSKGRGWRNTVEFTQPIESLNYGTLPQLF